jgi:hypothetical protein
MTSIQKTRREMIMRARLREASGRAVDRAAEFARIFLRFAILMCHALRRLNGIVRRPGA